MKRIAVILGIIVFMGGLITGVTYQVVHGNFIRAIASGDNNPQVVSFSLINTDNDQVISGFEAINDGAIINVNNLPTQHLNIRANTSPTVVGSVVFSIPGDANNGRVENDAPYALNGDYSGKYVAWSPVLSKTYTITAIPYSGRQKTGTEGKSNTLHITFTNPTTTKGSCANGTTLTLNEFKEAFYNHQINVSIAIDNSNLKGIATIENNTGCAAPVSYASYKMFDRVLIHQEFFNTADAVISSGSTQTLSINVPDCMTQTDVYYGAAPHVLNDPYYPAYISHKFNRNNTDNYLDASGQFCSHETQVTASCSVSVASIGTNESVTYSAQATGGTGTFGYSWSGDDSLTGSSSNVSKSYNTAGTKYAKVSVTSGNSTATASCSVTVTPPPPPQLTGSCTVNSASENIGDTVTFNSQATGGTGTYSYSWNGTDGLSSSSNSVSKAYGYAGTKTGTVTITSGSQSITQSCSTVVNPPQVPTLNLYCTASSVSTPVGSNITYTANPSGGTGSYSYSWNGTDNLSGSGQTASQSYNNAGGKVANVTVTDSGNRTATASCSVNVIPVTQDFGGYCYVNRTTANVNDAITWYAQGTGGNGNYSYSWTGDVSGYGSNVQSQYGSAGQKYATVAITSPGYATIYKTCSTSIVQPTVSLQGSCLANPSSAYVGDNVNWNVSATGGVGNYSYIWSGTDNFSSSGTNAGVVYTTPGQKTATVTINSGNQTVSQSCSVYISARNANVGIVKDQGPLPPAGAVYLSQVPYTGIGSDMKVGLFVLALFLWSGLISYIIVKRRADQDGLSMTEFVNSKIGPRPNTSLALSGIGMAGGTYSTDNPMRALKEKMVRSIPIIHTIPERAQINAIPHEPTPVNATRNVEAPIVMSVAAPVMSASFTTEETESIESPFVGEEMTEENPSEQAPLSHMVEQKFSSNVVPVQRQTLKEAIAAAHAAEATRNNVKEQNNIEKTPVLSSFFSNKTAKTEVPQTTSTTKFENSVIPAPKKVENKMPAVRPQTELDKPSRTEDVIETLESKARDLQAIVSADGLEVIAKASNHNKHNAMIILNHLVDFYRGTVEDQNDWLVLNGEKISKILFSTYITMTPVFIQWMVVGDDTKVLSFIRMLQMQGQSVKDFMTNIVLELDKVYRYRIEHDVDVDTHLVDITAEWSNEDLEHIVYTLVQAIDQGYKSTYASIKISLLKILDLAKSRMYA